MLIASAIIAVICFFVIVAMDCREEHTKVLDMLVRCVWSVLVVSVFGVMYPAISFAIETLA